jgi:putative ABC transport system ATP-binding protein
MTIDNAGAAEPILRFSDVVKAYRSGPDEVRALSDVSLDVAPGEFVAVMGPSGCGKSTLLHLAGALEEPTAGAVFVDGVNLASMGAVERAKLRRQRVGYVFQRLNLVPTLTALENVMLPLELDGTSTREAKQRASETLELVELTPPYNRYPDQFSGGQQQRIAIARAICGSRSIVLADEPTGSLDTTGGDHIIELLTRINADRGTALLLVTHEPRFASFADRIVFLRDGRVVDQARADGAADEPQPVVAR